MTSWIVALGDVAPLLMGVGALMVGFGIVGMLRGRLCGSEVAEPVRLCAQCQLGRGADLPVGDPRCPHVGQW